MILDCFRALPSNPLYGFNYSAGGTATGQTIGKPNYPIAMITLQIQALPYGRSDIDGVQNLALASPLSGGISPQTVLPSTLDTFNTVFNPPPIINAPVWTSLGFLNPTSVTSSFKRHHYRDSAPRQHDRRGSSEPRPTTSRESLDTGGNTYALARRAVHRRSVLPVHLHRPRDDGPKLRDHHSHRRVVGRQLLLGCVQDQRRIHAEGVLFQGNGTAATYSQALNVNQYTMVLSVGSEPG